MKPIKRRQFIQRTGLAALATTLLTDCLYSQMKGLTAPTIPISGHLWVYASKFPPNWDCTPVLETVFSDFQYAGMDGVELMEGQLRHDDAVSRINSYIKKYNVPVTGSSYGVGFGMWDSAQHKAIRSDLEIVLPRLAEVGGTTFGISVGSKKDGLKTEAELDVQAELLLWIRNRCSKLGIEANLHNHTYEVENDLHDLKGTLKRIPDYKLGPDLNWLIRAGVDPVDFINTYGKQIVYLHIRDQYADGKWTEYVGQGDTDFMPIAEALKKQGFKGKAAVELAFPNGFSPENALKDDWKKSREFVERTFGWS